VAVYRCRWAFISFACPKETEPKKRALGIIAISLKKAYFVARIKTRYAQTLIRFIHKIHCFQGR